MSYKKIILVILISFHSIWCYSQLEMEDLLNFKLGGSYLENKAIIADRLKNNVTNYKGDFLNSYKITSPAQMSEIGQMFSFYGQSDYEFLFVKNQLCEINIIFLFTANEKDEFVRLFTTLTSDIAKNKRLIFDKSKFSNLDINKAIKVVYDNCISREENKKNIDQDTILGSKYYFVDTAGIKRNKYLKFSVQNLSYNGELLRYDGLKGRMITSRYDGCATEVKLTVSNLDLLEMTTQLRQYRMVFYPIHDN